MNLELNREFIPKELIFGDAIAKMPPRPMIYHISKWVPARGYTIITGDPGTMKTSIALYMALALINNSTWMDRKTRKTRVMYVAGEGSADSGKDDIQMRLKALSRGTGLELTQDIMIYPDRLLIDDYTQLHYTAKLVQTYGIGMIIYDGLVGCVGNTVENDNQQVRITTERLVGALQPHGCVPLLIHHTAKSGPGGVHAGRGASDWGAGAASVVNISWSAGGKLLINQSKLATGAKSADPVVITPFTESKEIDGEDYSHSISFGHISKTVAVAKKWDIKANAVVEAIGSQAGPVQRRDIEKLTGIGGSTLDRVLNHGIDNGLLEKAGFGKYAVVN